MKRLVLAAGLLSLMAMPAFAMTEPECTAAWTAADVDKDGVVSATESSRYVAALRVAGKTIPADGKLTDTVFLENCRAGVFTTAKAEAGAPFAGANSFTEDQAKDRIVASGLDKVSNLTKDADGIWRGKATQADKNVSVAVDYKGNVVFN